jgi:hypothetical protein
MKTANKWVSELGYPELWEAIDEALLATASKHKEAASLAEQWVRVPKHVRGHLHRQLRAALRRRMPCP